jgi:hypothetical protein
LQDTVVNLAQLHAEAVAKLIQHGPVPFTRLERMCVATICGPGSVGPDTEPLVTRMLAEITDLGVPKYAALIAWLGPYGAALQAPELVGRLAMYLLGHTRVREESAIPVVYFDRLQG